MAFVLHALTPVDLFVDVGANIGAYTILAGAVAGARVICFEPIPATFGRFCANVRINQLENRIKALNIGIGHETGVLSFTDDLDTINHVLSPSETSTGKEVQVRHLDSLLEAENPACIKIDVEGFETRVLEGAKNILQKDCLHSLIIELNGHGTRYGFDEQNIMASLGDLGFQPYAYSPFNRSLTPLNKIELHPGNTLFIRNLQFVQSRIRNAQKYSVQGTEI